jgi:predicted nuclease of predicted toxin-antitoxin system
VKILLDANLSFRLVGILKDLFPECHHISEFLPMSASDDEIWNFAGMNGFTILSKDSDFHQRSFVFGAPPKVIWVRRGNCSTLAIGQVLREHRDAVEAFNTNTEATFLIVE